MSDRSVAEIVKARAKTAGLGPAAFAGHSLRAGFLTSAARAGASVWKMQEQSRHKSLNVLSGYMRSAQLFRDHAGEEFARPNPSSSGNRASPASCRPTLVTICAGSRRAT